MPVLLNLCFFARLRGFCSTFLILFVGQVGNLRPIGNRPQQFSCTTAGGLTIRRRLLTAALGYVAQAFLHVLFLEPLSQTFELQ
jgi:hypothetical protein